MKIVITGANGLVAKSVFGHCRDSGDKITALTREELDIRDASSIQKVFRDFTPEAVINCAAYTDVDGSEKNREMCREVNAVGVENLAVASRETGCRFLTISTDYVFDGTKNDLYDQRDNPNPLSYYGKTKLEGEIAAKTAYARSIIVRTGWVFGNNGTNFLSTMHEFLRAGKEIKAIDDSFGTPTYSDDLAVRIRSLIELDLPLIYHAANAGSEISFYDFAREICDLENLDVGLVARSSAEDLERPAERPRQSGLRCLYSERLGMDPMPGWKDALRMFLDKKETQVSESSNT